MTFWFLTFVESFKVVLDLLVKHRPNTEIIKNERTQAISDDR